MMKISKRMYTTCAVLCCHDHGGVMIDCESVKERSLYFVGYFTNIGNLKLFVGYNMFYNLPPIDDRRN